MKNTHYTSFAIAHRGASQLAPENTLAALTAAKKAGATWVECDIQLTKDGVPVILHDTTLNRTTNGRGKLLDIALSKLKTLDAGSWFSKSFQDERVPTLPEWLKLALTLQLNLNLEIKSATKKESSVLADVVIDHLQKFWPAHSTSIFISSSNLFLLMQMAECANSLPLGLIHEKKISSTAVKQLIQSNIISVHQPFKIIDQQYVEMLHENGLRILAYTVNDLACAEKLKAMDVDGIFTDNADLYDLKVVVS